jgi:hypothetical protein
VGVWKVMDLMKTTWQVSGYGCVSRAIACGAQIPSSWM